MPDGRIVLFCKGADNIILERTTQNLTKEELQLKEKTLSHLNAMAVQGYRTLLYATRELSEEEYSDFEKRYEAAKMTLVDRNKTLEEVGESIEHELKVIGGTGIEDKLQDQVPETIDKLRNAGIRVWVLTGDKRETVINVGKASKIIKENSKLIQFKIPIQVDAEGTGSTKGGRASLEYFNLFQSSLNRYHELIKSSTDHFVLIVDGYELKQLCEFPVLRDKFMILSSKVDTVICCRVSPVQKAIVVKMVRDRMQVLLSYGSDFYPRDGTFQNANIEEPTRGILDSFKYFWRYPVVTCSIGKNYKE
jgi:magnesium-transporting ATPase (P-type)